MVVCDHSYEPFLRHNRQTLEKITWLEVDGETVSLEKVVIFSRLKCQQLLEMILLRTPEFLLGNHQV